MDCPYCYHKDTYVLESRDREDEPVIRRRRECNRCHKRFTTYERIETDLTVIKRDNRREAFDRDKLIRGMTHACKKRPVTVEQLNKIADRVEAKLRNMNTTSIESSIIGNLVMQELKRIDKVAYIRFASVYREFDDAKDFKVEIRKLT